MVTCSANIHLVFIERRIVYLNGNMAESDLWPSCTGLVSFWSYWHKWCTGCLVFSGNYKSHRFTTLLEKQHVSGLISAPFSQVSTMRQQPLGSVHITPLIFSKIIWLWLQQTAPVAPPSSFKLLWAPPNVTPNLLQVQECILFYVGKVSSLF